MQGFMQSVTYACFVVRNISLYNERYQHFTIKCVVPFYTRWQIGLIMVSM